MKTIEDFETLLILAAIAVGGYLVWKFSSSLSANEDPAGGTPAGAISEIGRSIGINTSSDTGGRQCTYTDMRDGTCIDTNGRSCSWLSFLTGYSCYQGTPLQNPIGIAPSDVSGAGGGF